ncbi:MAG: hypothetical protein CFE21_21695 [Bacteroidetes bacterium B1(2017)]|nr:MAG: hypothetical protein CFE21_21695 [Bacteroidetes bacterium B1(2017)]
MERSGSLKTSVFVRFGEYKTYTGVYRFHFNGQESDNEIAGVGNINTAEFWEYDSRLGRRWNLDPKPKTELSNYICFNNNPIIFVDPNGDNVINGDQLKANESVKNHTFWNNKKTEFMKNHGINEKTKRKDFIKAGGTKDEWNEYSVLKKDVKDLKSEMTYWNARAEITEGIIKKWKEESRTTFDEVDQLNVDFLLSSEDLSSKNYFGVNNLNVGENIINFQASGYEGHYTKPAISVVISQDVNISTIDIETGQYSLNHEAGHFIYVVKNQEEYFKYIQELREKKRGFNGGHNDDDKGGELAKRYGSRK